jgi:hypothetical protein
MTTAPKRVTHWLTPRLTRQRMVLALVIAAAADVIQIALLPFTWTFVQAAVDVVAMVLVLPVLGFHLLLLPTFVIEFLPGVDMLPTWTGCVVAVIALKKRAQGSDPTAPPPPVTEITEANKPSNRNEPPIAG